LHLLASTWTWWKAEGCEWTPTTWQSTLLLCLNLLQSLALLSGIIYSLYNLRNIIQESQSVKFSTLFVHLLGIVMAMFSLMLLFPITTYLIRTKCSCCRKGGGIHASTRHFILGFTILLILLFYVLDLSPWSPDAFDEFFKWGSPSWDKYQ